MGGKLIDCSKSKSCLLVGGAKAPSRRRQSVDLATLPSRYCDNLPIATVTLVTVMLPFNQPIGLRQGN